MTAAAKRLPSRMRVSVLCLPYLVGLWTMLLIISFGVTALSTAHSTFLTTPFQSLLGRRGKERIDQQEVVLSRSCFSLHVLSTPSDAGNGSNPLDRSTFQR